MSEISTCHWSEDPYWVGAAERFYKHREDGARQLVIDLDAINDTLYNGDGPAYRLLEAMLSVHQHEGMDGFRGAPRLVLALLQILSELGQSRTFKE